MYRNILVAVDGSGFSMAAAALAAELAGRSGGQAEALFVKDRTVIRSTFWRDFGALLLPTMRFDEQLDSFFQARGEAVLETLRGRHPRLSGRIVEGRPEREILEAARDAELLVIGAAGESHEEDGDSRHLGGRVARLVARARVPVLLSPQAPAVLERVRLAYGTLSGKAAATAADLAATARLPLEAVSLGDGTAEDRGRAAEVLAEAGAAGVVAAHVTGPALEGLRASLRPGDLLVLSGRDFEDFHDAVAELEVPVAVSPS